MDITWEILENVLQPYRLQKNSVDGGIITHKRGEKCPGLCPGLDIQDLTNL